MSNSVKFLVAALVLIGAWVALRALEPETYTEPCGSDRAAGGG